MVSQAAFTRAQQLLRWTNVWPHAVDTGQNGEKRGLLCPFPWGSCSHLTGGARSPSNTMWPAQRPTSIKWYLYISSRLTTIDMGRKVGGYCFHVLGLVEMGPNLTQCRLGPGRILPPYQAPPWSIQPFGHNRYGQKWECVPLLGGAVSPSNKMWPGPRFTSIYQTASESIQPFSHNTPTSQTGQTDRQRSDSIGRTVLQTVAHKWMPALSMRAAQSFHVHNRSVAISTTSCSQHTVNFNQSFSYSVLCCLLLCAFSSE